MCIATNGKLNVPLSAQDVCFNSNTNGCNGGMIDTPWTFFQHHGAVSGGQYKGSSPFGSGFCVDFSLPHCHHHGPQGDDPYPAEGKKGCPSEKSPKGPKKCGSTFWPTGRAHDVRVGQVLVRRLDGVGQGREGDPADDHGGRPRRDRVQRVRRL